MPLYMGPLAWKSTSPTKTASGRLTTAVGVIKLVVDLIIFYIPIPVVVNLKLSTRKRMGVLTTFLTGSIAIVADIVDLFFRIEVSNGRRPFIYGIYVPLCSLVEAGISVIVASMPSAAKIWRRHIVGSGVYNILRSMFPESNTPAIHKLPSDLQLAKERAAKKRRVGLYSILTLMTTYHDTPPTLKTTQDQTNDARKSNEEHVVEELDATSEKPSASFDSSSRTPNNEDQC
ncbi:hypothetical protein BDU57DRAFT_531162 [Ampelomyces quisqualis]|uniref:Rhodopsin domain-containing protein n=1 Tax=Ampelomyces quisqualis TaxID=50730 RepID=A0A6A5QKX4_AMPQU|nr:hypothetical protein BDU57DRAFT_531162 [Ampelomyces quisqualis]